MENKNPIKRQGGDLKTEGERGEQKQKEKTKQRRVTGKKRRETVKKG